MKPLFPIALILSAAIASPLAAQEQAEAGDDTVMATINGEPYSLATFRMFYAERIQQTGAQNTPEFQQRAFNEFLNLVVAAQEAEKRDLGQSAEVQQALALQKMMIMSTAALQDIAEKTTPSEDELTEAYERFKEQSRRTEYKARHILVETKDEADDLIKKLDKKKGKNFEDLAKEHSIGPTAEKGGDLGWFDARQMVKPFSDAVGSLEPGSYTEQPVQTQFGWHVIMLEETRTAEPPSFEEAKPQLEASIKRQKVTEALGELRSEADVDLNEDVVQLREDAPEEEN
ncbi:MAG: peptidylprolyl isomerase [Thiohalocapsa sp.]|nr:peptidylprolyl isomerase [Thiohalocapsa sp.]MCF7991406.1 peptidylprolyl isomerase [Thiohalocapsa sp.]